LALSEIATIVALIVSTMALVYSIKSFSLKSGSAVRGSYHLSGSIKCNDQYVSRVIVENLKDKSVIVFGVFLELSRNIILEIERFEKEPLIIRPWETYTKEYDSIDSYSSKFTRVNIDSLLGFGKRFPRIVLSTSDGKLVASGHINKWDASVVPFKNIYARYVQAHRLKIDGACYGENVLYLVEILGSDDKRIDIIPIYPGDWMVQRFNDLPLSKTSLESRGRLEKYLNRRFPAKWPNVGRVKVHDVNEIKKKQLNLVAGFEKLHPIGWLKYTTIGYLSAWIKSFRLRRSRKK